jgi:hypothetical protein
MTARFAAIDNAIRKFLEKAHSDQKWMESMGQDYRDQALTIDIILANPDRAKTIWSAILANNTTKSWIGAWELDNAITTALDDKENSAFKFCKVLWLNIYH